MQNEGTTCACGCGGTPNPSRRFIHGHNARLQTPRYRSEDRGHETPCWVWQRAIGSEGYGLTDGGLAHRTIYKELVGPIPEGLQIDHLCRNRACVNPAHLEPVTAAENNRRRPNIKLTLTDATAIRHERHVPARLMAARYGVSEWTVYDIRSGRRWPEA